jgi:hypothetical protein
MIKSRRMRWVGHVVSMGANKIDWKTRGKEITRKTRMEVGEKY